jgi:bifunctional non-homologous end joining protein LigD
MKRAAAGHNEQIPAFVEPMKARLTERPPPGDWLYEIKWDGYRAMALLGSHTVRLLSRNNKDLGSKFPELLPAFTDLKTSDTIIDGEIVALDEAGRPSFQLLQAREIGKQRPPIFFYAFDLPRLEGRSLVSQPIEARKKSLKALLRRAEDRLRFSATLGSDANSLLQEISKLGLEGLIGKRAQSRYEPGARSGAWIKLKIQNEQEFVIGGYTEPSGSRKFFGAVLVGVYDAPKLTFVAKVGTGFDDDLLRSLYAGFQNIRQDACPFWNLPEKRSGSFGQGVTATEMKRCRWIRPC